MRLTNTQIKNEMKTNVNLFTITPSAIIKTFSIQEFSEILGTYPPSYNLLLRLRAIEISFVENENYEHAAIIRDWRLKTKQLSLY